MKISDPEKNQEAINAIQELEDVQSAVEVNGQINIRALDAVGKLPRIIDKVESLELNVVDLSMRQNTLEDVFIDLTGTGLRE
jgi:ABC-2 type transport system ATP-binding protein